MSRISIVCLTSGDAENPTAKSFRAAAKTLEMSFHAVAGEPETLLASASDWAVLPEVIVLEAPEGADPKALLIELGARVPAGEASVMVAGARNDIRLYRELKAMGVVEVFADAPTPEEARAALEEVAARAQRRTGIDPRRAVYVWSSCGGAGGTSVALSVARSFARDGRRTLLVDMDLATAPISFMLAAERGARETHGLIDALMNPSRIDALFLERAIEPAGSNLYFLSARRRDDEREFDPSGLASLIARAQTNFDMVVVDVPWRAFPQPEMTEVYGHSYVVACPSPAGLLGFSILMKELAASGSKMPVVGVLNRAGEFRGADISLASFRGDFQGEMVQIPYDAASVGGLFFEQKTLLDASSRVRRAFEKLTATLPAPGTEAAAKKPRRKLRFFGGFFATTDPDGMKRKRLTVADLIGPVRDSVDFE